MAAAPAPDDDLTRIRGIDRDLGAKLIGLGVRRYADIANWKRNDIQLIADRLGMNGRVERENWIEQAQVLAKGGETDYSRRLAQATMTLAKPTANEGEKLAISIPPPAVKAASAPTPAAPGSAVPAAIPAISDAAKVAAAAATAAATAAAAVVKATTAPPVQPAPAPVAAKAAAPVAPASAGSPPAPPPPAAAVAPAIKPVVPVPPVVPAAPIAAPFAKPAVAAAPASAATPAAAASGIDDLTRIRGIDASMQKKLQVLGVTRFADVAKWGGSDVARVNDALGATKRVEQENWIEQAQVLAKGGDTDYSRRLGRASAAAPGTTAAAAAATAAVEARPAKLADAIRGNTAEPAKAAPRTDLSGLRSVRSEALRGDAAEGGRGLAGLKPAAGLDDLKRIRGVGVLIEKKLNSLGVTAYEQVANWTSQDIDRISNVLDFKGRIERENWVEQARILASGGQTEFSRELTKAKSRPAVRKADGEVKVSAPQTKKARWHLPPGFFNVVSRRRTRGRES